MVNEIQRIVDEYIKSTDDGYWPPLAMFAALVEEVGETGRIINSLENFKPLKNNGKTRTSHDLLQEELGDVFFALCCLANYYNVSLDKALTDTLDKYAKRK